jgi:hypothetical protein
LWKRFDDACNEAHKVVEGWLDKIKAESAEHRAQRVALIEEVNVWAAANPLARDNDWKGFNRLLNQFGDRWRDGGHVGEKVFAELQPLWKTAINAAAAPLEALQKSSLAVRQAMIEEAKVLGAQVDLRIDAVKALQQRWQAETHVVPLDRRQEQKLWDAFRKPIDEAFSRKTAERERVNATLGERDRVVLEAAKALEVANSGGDAQSIHNAMNTLEAALRGQAQAQAAVAAVATVDTGNLDLNSVLTPLPAVREAIEIEAGAELSNAPADVASVEAELPPKTVAKPVVAVRGDDRPGMKKSEPAPAGRGPRFAERKEAGPNGSRDGGRGPRGAPSESRADDRRPSRDRRDGAAVPWVEAPRLGDTAFRAQRDALEHAQFALRKLAVQAHGEALTQVLIAWERRDVAQLPSTKDLGARVSVATRVAWTKALTQAPIGDASVALLRLEMAAELPTPAEHLNARRALQLQLLTKRNDPAPVQTWGQDTSTVLAASFDSTQARRLQNALKVLLRP